jgi:hypothetical protein
VTPEDLQLLTTLNATFQPESTIITMAKKNGTKSPVVEDETLNAAALEGFEDEAFDDSGTEEEQIGFPPYWTPSEGRKLKVRVTALDQRDPEFVRWIVQATHKVACQSGPADESEPRLVQAGEFFSMSMYAGLPLQRYIGEEVVITCKEERDIAGGKTFWVWSVKVTPEVKARVAARLAERAQLLNQSTEQNPLLMMGDDLYAQTQAQKARIQEALKAAKNLA